MRTCHTCRCASTWEVVTRKVGMRDEGTRRHGERGDAESKAVSPRRPIPASPRPLFIPHPLIGMAHGSHDNRRRCRVVALVAFIVIALLTFAAPRLISKAAMPGAESESQQRPQTRGRATRASAPPRRINYSSFSHQTQQHRRACNDCHKFPSANWKKVRTGDAAFPDVTEYPEHSSCLECHREQFFARERPAPAICSVCHVANSPRNTTRWPFPSLGDTFYASKRGQNFVSDFRINFPHATHIEIVSQLQNDSREAYAGHYVRAAAQSEAAAHPTPSPTPAPTPNESSCNVCHQTYKPQGNSNEEYVTKPPPNLGDAFWLKKGTFKTVLTTHATCFTCHSADADIAPKSSDCATCHKLTPLTQLAPARVDFDPRAPAAVAITDPIMLMRWRRRGSSATFRHEGGAHPDQACTSCHNVTEMNTTDDRTMRVPVMSCNLCHIGASADEAVLNAEMEQRKRNPSFQCTKCHLTFGREPVPQSHIQAVRAAQGH